MFRVATYNIRKGQGASGRNLGHIDALARALVSLEPDVMLCQEVAHGVSKVSQQSHVLAQHLKLAACYVPNRVRGLSHSGNASLSRFKIQAVQNYDISTNRIERCGALYAQLMIAERPVHVFNVRLGLY